MGSNDNLANQATYNNLLLLLNFNVDTPAGPCAGTNAGWFVVGYASGAIDPEVPL